MNGLHIFCVKIIHNNILKATPENFSITEQRNVILIRSSELTYFFLLHLAFHRHNKGPLPRKIHIPSNKAISNTWCLFITNAFGLITM